MSEAFTIAASFYDQRHFTELHERAFNIQSVATEISDLGEAFVGNGW